MLRITVVEDESASAQLLKEYIQRYSQERGIPVEVSVFEDGLSFIGNYEPPCDVVLMDIEMPNVDGMKAAEMLRKVDTKVNLVFVTNMAKYAIRGYEVEAIGFIVKPVNYYALALLFDKVVQRKQADQEDQVLIPVDGGRKRVALSDIYYIEVIDHLLIYHTAEGALMSAGKLAELEKSLGQRQFFRCQKSFLINLKYVTEIKSQFVLVHGNEIPVGRNKRKELIDVFCKYLGVTQ